MYLGLKGGGYVRLTPHRHLWADCLGNLGVSTSHNPVGLHGLLRDSFTVAYMNLIFFRLKAPTSNHGLVFVFSPKTWKMRYGIARIKLCWYKYYVSGHYPSSYFYLKHNVSESGCCRRLQVKPTQFDSIHTASPCLQKHNICINVLLSQFRSGSDIVWYEELTPVSIKRNIFGIITSCNLVQVRWGFGRTYHRNLQDWQILLASCLLLDSLSSPEGGGSRYSDYLGLDDRGVLSSSPGMIKNFLHVVYTGSGVHPTSYPMGTRGFFPGGEAAGAWNLPLISS
jgi:hypothetical protein